MSSATIGVITNNQYSVFQSRVIVGIHQAADERGCRVVVDSFAENPEAPRTISLHPNDVNGIVIIANAAPRDYLLYAYDVGKPLSLISHQFSDIPIPAVVMNNVQGVAELVKHVLVRCHRRQPVFIRGIMEQNDAMQRETAFRQEIMRYHVDVPESRFVAGEFTPSVAAASIVNLIDSGETFDAVIASDYLMANAIVEQLRALNKRVPEDVSVVGFGDAPEAERAGLTTVAADVQKLGWHGARQLISQIDGLRIRGVTRLSVDLVIRDTCGYKAEHHADLLGE
jgi:DNA-binding LacI/PurR family transcriptional regulator